MKIRLNMNNVIKVLINGNITITAAWGFINPFFAVFVCDKIIDGSLIVVGIGSTLYWIVKSILQMPIAMVMDKFPSEDVDSFALVFGSFLISIVPFCFLFSTKAFHIYILQVVLAIGDALRVPSWNAIFTRHIDTGKEGTEWGVNSTGAGFAVAITSFIGSYIAEKIGFQGVFIFGGIISILGSIFFIKLFNHLRNMPGGKKTFGEFVDYLKDGIIGR